MRRGATQNAAPRNALFSFFFNLHEPAVQVVELLCNHVLAGTQMCAVLTKSIGKNFSKRPLLLGFFELPFEIKFTRSKKKSVC
jgi:hypothetical protein